MSLEDFLIVNEEFGEGSILDTTDKYAEIMFEHGIERIDLESIIVEEVESLDVVSKETLVSYKNKANAQVDATKKRGKPSSTTIALRAKRRAGLEAAEDRLHKIRSAERAKHEEESKSLGKSLDDHFAKEAPKILAKHGFEKVHDHANQKTYIHKHENGHATMISLHNRPNKYDSLSSPHSYKTVNRVQVS